MGQTASQVAAPRHSLEGDDLCTCIYAPLPATHVPPTYLQFLGLRETIRHDFTRLLHGPVEENHRELSRTIDIHAALGKGGFGCVALVLDRTTGEIGALKCIAKERMSRSGNAERRERELLYKLSSFFSVILKANTESPRFLRLLMEFTGGNCLHYVIHGLDDDKIWYVQDTKFFLAQIALAIDHLQSLSVVHYDLKPANILVSYKGYIKLCDYGLSKMYDPNKREYTRRGTHQYMAPEVALGNLSSGLGADVYAFGVLTYEFFHQRVPYPDMRKIIKMQTRPKPRLADWLRDDNVVANFILGLMECNPAIRLGCGAAGFLEVLQHPFFKGVNFGTLFLQQYSCPVEISTTYVSDTYPIHLYDDGIVS